MVYLFGEGVYEYDMKGHRTNSPSHPHISPLQVATVAWGLCILPEVS